MKRQLSAELHAAYDWTDAAGEIGELTQLTGPALARYCRESEENCQEHGGDVTAADLDSLAAWLRGDR